MKYSDEQRIQKIYENARKLLDYLTAHAITKEALLNDYALQWLVNTPLYNIGEHAYYLSDEFKSVHPEFEWFIIAGLRHRLVHDYDGTNWNIIAEVVFEELPVLVKQNEKMLE